ncbi:MAG: DUF1800 family protein [Candidatus Didemnitutus sp.]|nr:DUF1800 family protein [Candidatus Didemnitutus sp.]
MAAPPVDANNDGLGDLWQLRYGAQSLLPNGDEDGDGLSNAVEALLGTDPFSANSGLAVELAPGNGGAFNVRWGSVAWKRYTVQVSSDLITWTPQHSVVGNGSALESSATPLSTEAIFTRLAVTDDDTDGDGISDWEERLAGYDPRRTFSEGLGSNPTTPTANNPRITDWERFRTQLANTTNLISIVAVEPEVAEGWPHPAVALVRRAGGLNTVTVNFSLGGSATPAQDYVAPGQLSVTIPFGADQAVVELPLVTDSAVEGTETIVVQLQTGLGYTLDPAEPTSATFRIADAAAGLSVGEATRFLQQATFGPTPAELARVRSLGIAAWVDAQLARPIALHLPLVQTWYAERNTGGLVIDNTVISAEHRLEAFWRQGMRDDDTADPLRQRVAFALSQIFVISDRASALNNDQRGMTAYYDVLLTHAFGNYRQLLEAVTRHPWMGLYLSALRNRKADVSINRYPDENYAREIMQLFSIGLWRLNPDGSHYLSNGADLDPNSKLVPAGLPIPTYGQSQVQVLARVFTGFSHARRFSSTTNFTEIATTGFFDSRGVPWQPMRFFDSEHDVAAKTIWLPGAATLNLPIRTSTSSATTTSGDADLTATLDYLAAHPNVGPFICQQLIQRLVTSNPTPAYVARISAVFANNGSGVRGDLRAVVRALLLDPEARSFASTQDVVHGQVREPYTRYISAARALGAGPKDASAGGRYRSFQGIDADFLQRPLSAPSVFNFYTSDYVPPGPMRAGGYVSPELQILNGVSTITGPNRFSTAFNVTSSTGLTRFNSSPIGNDPTTPDVNEALWNSPMDEAGWLPVALATPEVLVATLARSLCARPLTPESFRAITRGLRRMADPHQSGISTTTRDQRALHRLRLAAHLITIAPESAVLR